MPPITLRRVVQAIRRAVIREFLRAYREGILDDNRIGFAIHRVMVNLVNTGVTGVWIPNRRSHNRSSSRRRRAPPVVVPPPPPATATSTQVPASVFQMGGTYPHGYCPFHGFGPCALRDAGVLEATLTAAYQYYNSQAQPDAVPMEEMLATVAAPNLYSPTPEVEPTAPRWRPPTPAPPGFGRPPTRAARTGCPPFFNDDEVIPPPPSAVPMPSPALIERSRGAQIGLWANLNSVKVESPNSDGASASGFLFSDEEREDSLS
ncbi:hypothetical protein Zm00014a_041877 [Zea mays]|jgi:hypothetical protein|uniref:Uncharacterized protein n=1 Tax=Zea mays TaxID=4577 RepID=A0A3L6DAP7_MAIZE|nr:hypothetical protein Zm00014a_041877 [Zea mays]